MSKMAVPLRHNPEAGRPLVELAEGLTAEWLTNVLKARGLIAQSRVVGVKQAPVGNGMLGSNIRLDLDYDQAEPAAPKSLVAKLASTRSESRDSSAAFQLYIREASFYQELAPTLKIGVPETLFADASADGRSCCLLFENLAPARGGDQLTGCDVADAEVAMDAAAALHGPRWGDAALESLPWLARDTAISTYTSLFGPCVPAMRARYAQLLEPEVVAITERFAPYIAAYFAMQCAPWTITHQDFRLDNMLFDACGGRMPVAVLDWQTVLLGPGTTDVSYFLGAGLLPELRRPNEEALVRRYHEALLTYGVRDYGWQRCWQDYRLYAAQGLITAVIAAVVATPTERGDQMLSTMVRRHAQHMIDHDTLSLIH